MEYVRISLSFFLERVTLNIEPLISCFTSQKSCKLGFPSITLDRMFYIKHNTDFVGNFRGIKILWMLAFVVIHGKKIVVGSGLNHTPRARVELCMT